MEEILRLVSAYHLDKMDKSAFIDPGTIASMAGPVWNTTKAMLPSIALMFGMSKYNRHAMKKDREKQLKQQQGLARKIQAPHVQRELGTSNLFNKSRFPAGLAGALIGKKITQSFGGNDPAQLLGGATGGFLGHQLPSWLNKWRVNRSSNLDPMEKQYVLGSSRR